MILQEFKKKANYYGINRTPFVFLIDFELNKPYLCTVREAKENKVYFKAGQVQNTPESFTTNEKFFWEAFPVSYTNYLKAFRKVMENIRAGNSYLLNLTFPTKIKTKQTLQELFDFAHAPYKFYFKDQFIVFSPECFVKIQNNRIFSYPMKGTIDAGLPDAAGQILGNKKEEWEHNTIVDLIRNDLALVAKNIVVTKFRYITKIMTNDKNLLQVSSEIRGALAPNWQKNIGDVLIQLLPAGSVSGAPKQKTLEIIKQVEKTDRGYFTGIFGVFDGENMDSAVNIRYIEKTADGLQYRSGGGITANSNSTNEYNEMIDKVYVPLS